MATASTPPTTGIELNRLTRRPPPLSTLRFLTEDLPPPLPHDNDDDLHESIALPTYEDESSKIEPLWKRRLYRLLEQPTSSKAAFIVHMFITFMIVFSAFVTVLETVPAVHEISTRVWFGLETSVVALFTIEYIARLIAWSNTWTSLLSWILSFYGIIDLLSVLPYYLELLLQQDTSVYFRFSILRMFRLLRVFRPFRYNHTILLTIEVMYLSVRRSQHALFALGFFVIMILTVFSTLLYFAERGTWDEVLGTFINSEGDPTQFSSIPASAWFVLVTITTVGYGEITPRSFLGRLITLPILVFGLLFITLPSFVLGREFSHVWERLTQDRLEVSDEANMIDTDPTAQQDTENGSARVRHTVPPLSPSLSPVLSARSRTRPRPSSSRVDSSASDAPYTHIPRNVPGPGPGTPGTAPARMGAPGSVGPMGTAGYGYGYGGQQRDLSNLKLAQNQTELSRQIDDLAGVVEAQGRMLSRLLELLEEKEREGGKKS